MMKRSLLILLVLLAGCIVQSFQPFYTGKSKVELPQLNGNWDAIKAFGNPLTTSNVPPWQISADQIVAYDPDSKPSKIDVSFFKLGSQLFCDSTAGNSEGQAWYWAWHTRPIHTVTRVETNGNLLVFKPLDLNWLTNGVATGKISLPYISRPEDDRWPLFTATPAQWEQFLAMYADDTNAFPDTHSYVLKRHASE